MEGKVILQIVDHVVVFVLGVEESLDILHGIPVEGLVVVSGVSKSNDVVSDILS